MADIDNGYGETMPDETSVTLFLDGQNKILLANPALPDGIGGTVAKSIYNPAIWVTPMPADPTTFHTLDQAKHSFTYMDCGRWGGPAALGSAQRGFGIVWGPWAALCQFVPDASCSTNANYVLDNTGARANNKINDVIDGLRSSSSSVRLVKSLWSATPPMTPAVQNIDWSAIYVILPDLHLPICVKRPDTRHVPGNDMGMQESYEIEDDGPTMGRVDYDGPDSPNGLSKNAQAWFDYYLAGDIFGTPDNQAAKDLTRFMTLLSQSGVAGQISFVQLGDLYDLWIGLDCFFDGNSAFSVNIGDRNGVRAGDFIDFWVNRTNQIFSTMIPTINAMPNHRFLWGNHDNYLAAHTPSGLTPRIKEVREKSIYIEHGHRGDAYNRDGATRGQWITNQVFQHKQLRALDPNRRPDFVSTAAAAYAISPDFCVYVMGHTHSPYLTRVNVLMRPN